MFYTRIKFIEIKKFTGVSWPRGYKLVLSVPDKPIDKSAVTSYKLLINPLKVFSENKRVILQNIPVTECSKLKHLFSFKFN